MKKTLCWVASCLLILGSVGLTGCGQDQEAALADLQSAEQSAGPSNDEAGSADLASVSPSREAGTNHLNETVSATFGIDLEIDPTHVTKLPVVEAEPFDFELDKVKAALFPGQEPDVIEDEGPDPGYSLRSGDIWSIFSSSDRFSNLAYVAPYSEQVFDVCAAYGVAGIAEEANSIAAEFKEAQAVPYATPAEAETEFINLLRELGIDNAGDITVYALDHTVLQSVAHERAAEQEAQNPAEGKTRREYKDEWTSEDDCYLLIARCMVNDVPVKQQDTVGPADEYAINGSHAAALLNAAGLQYLDISMFVQNPVNGDSESILPVEQALEAVKLKYGDLITENKSTVVDAELIYSPLPSGDRLELTPAWSFTILEQQPPVEFEGELVQNEPHEVYETVNAITGTEFMANQGDWK
ncbi:MAG: hypothetical protein HDQ87_07225 [Clostridia bacterium]|nr:hypothetical protein [Clostridia bacterium]